MDETLLTVVTPTYNRAHTLPVCYQSLYCQTDKRFKWLIIDDGSTDSTAELINNWIKEKRIPIEYVKKENGGKASALNVGLGMLRTPYAVCLDSDDVFYEDTVEKSLKSLDKASKDEKCCGVLALRNNPDGTVMGHKLIPSEMKIITAADIFLKLELRTELICFYKTEVLKNYRFPEFRGEKFVSPAWMQYEITQKYYFQTSWDKLCCCEYIGDGLTKNKRKVIVKNPRGYTCVKRLSFDLSESLNQVIKNGIMYDCGCLLGNDKEWLKNAPKKGWAFLLMPAAVFVKIKRFGKYLNEK